MLDTVARPGQTETTTDVLVVGTGFAGLAMAIRLQEAGFFDVLLLEKGMDVGGTWRDNTYPGCACDIPSHLYSLSFAQAGEWSRLYPRQPELLAYLRRVADTYGLRPRIRFNTTMQGAVWDAAAGVWHVETDRGRFRARVLISGAGALHIPAAPALPGLETFRGKTFHSAQWDPGFDPAGQRIAVIGTGASAIQIVPELAKTAAELHVYQRTPAWIMPKPDRAFSSLERALLRLPPYRAAFRKYLFMTHELRVLAFMGNKRAQNVAARMARAHLAAQVSDPALREKLSPTYEMGCKRVMISNDFYPALTQPHVRLVTDPIATISASEVTDAQGVARAVDAIVFATGFEVTSAYRHMNIAGTNGRSLAALWDETGLQAFNGLAVSGFPNYFLLLGPHTGLGHNSVVIMIEAQVGYIVDLLTQMRSAGVQVADVQPAAQTRFVDMVAQRLVGTVWQDGGCDSWYKDRHGRVSAIWPGSAAAYQKALRRADLRDYAFATTEVARQTA